MIGNNTLELCEAEMANAVEYYLNHAVFKIMTKVYGIDVKNTGSVTFLVRLKEPEDEDGNSI